MDSFIHSCPEVADRDSGQKEHQIHWCCESPLANLVVDVRALPADDDDDDDGTVDSTADTAAVADKLYHDRAVSFGSQQRRLEDE